jgi:hypothetical protein
MKARNSTPIALAILAAALGGAPLAHSQADPVRIPLDGEQVVGGVQIGCTGVGQSKDDPRWKAYPIRVEASNPGGDLLANVAISLSGKDGALLASVRCAGPWVMLKPPPGAYQLEGWMPGSGLKHQTAPVSPPASGQKTVTLIFPQS